MKQIDGINAVIVIAVLTAAVVLAAVFSKLPSPTPAQEAAFYKEAARRFNLEEKQPVIQDISRESGSYAVAQKGGAQ